ncbi:hypothetical protein [Devosia sp. CAU 1758]
MDSIWEVVTSAAATLAQAFERSIILREVTAQEGTVYWAQMATIISAVQALIALFGTVALVVTIRQGRRANKIASDAIVANQRAWIKTDLRVDGPVHFSEYGASLNVGIVIKNIGQTPALDCQTDVSMIHEVLNTKTMVRTIAARNRQINENFGRTCLPGEEYVREWTAHSDAKDVTEAILGGGVTILIVGCVTYRVPNDTEPHQTWFSYLLEPRNRERFDPDGPAKQDVSGYQTWTGGHAD